MKVVRFRFTKSHIITRKEELDLDYSLTRYDLALAKGHKVRTRFFIKKGHKDKRSMSNTTEIKIR